MTLKERIFKLKELNERYRKLYSQKHLPETSITLSLTQDWETEIKRRKELAENQKRIEKELEKIESEIKEHETYLKQLLYELNLECIEFDLKDTIIRITNLEEPSLSFIPRKEVVKNER
jgi:alpha-mannosidase